MQISFHHTNPAASHDSTLLKVTPRDEDPYWYLIDAGESVSPAAFTGPETSLDGVFITHAHRDHYASLGDVLSPDVPLYVSQPTGEILRQAYREADRYQDLGNSEVIAESITPIETWTELTDGIYVLPIPAGHTPGAAAFLFRIDDLQYNNETVTILATGDFTRHPVAGYPELTIPESIDIDILIANAATTPAFPENLSNAAETILERGLSGATTLVAAGALTGIHIAYVLGHLTEELQRSLPIHLVGQAAKLYAALDYDVPSVSLHPEFDHTDDVLNPGVVTIAGPDAPTDGSTKRLFGVIKDNADAVFIQLMTSSPDRVDGVACATHHIELSNHPSEQQFLAFIQDNLPRHLIFKHVTSDEARTLGSNFDNLFHWENDDMDPHRLYDDGEWPAPSWLNDGTATRIQQRNYQEGGTRMPIDGPITELPTVSWDRTPPTIAAEGIAVTELKDAFESTQPQQQPRSETPETTATQPAGEPEDTTQTESNDTPPAQTSTDTSEVPWTELRDRLDAIEATLDDVQDHSPVEETIETGIETIEERLDTLETDLTEVSEELTEDEPPTVTATVLRQNDLVLFRVDPKQLEAIDDTIPHESEIELALPTDDLDE